MLRWRYSVGTIGSSRLSYILIGVVTFVLAFGLSHWLTPSGNLLKAAAAGGPSYGMVDPVDAQHEAGYRIYIEQCASCHVALPPAVLPTNTWQALVTDPSHYGVVLPAFTQFDQQLMLNYLRPYSAPHEGGGTLPYRLQDSRYFQALHPDVDLPQPLNLRSCASCHLNAGEQDYSLGSNSLFNSSPN